MSLDIGPEEFEKLTRAIGARLAGMTGLPLEVAELAAVSVVCSIPVDEEGMLHFTDPEGRAVATFPFGDFADLLEGDEPEEEEPSLAPGDP